MFHLRKAGAWLRARVIDDWRGAWRFASVWLAAIGAAAEVFFMFAPPELYALLMLPGWAVRALPIILFLLVIAGRLVKQEGSSDDR